VRKLKCLQMSGNSVQEVLDEFNERRMEFGVTEESDVISGVHCLQLWEPRSQAVRAR
jgi:hypothetical protein